MHKECKRKATKSLENISFFYKYTKPMTNIIHRNYMSNYIILTEQTLLKHIWNLRSTWDGLWQSESNNWKRNCIFFQGWFLICYSWLWPKIDLILCSFLFFGGCFAVYKFSQLKNPAPSSSWGLSLTCRDGKTSGSLSWFLDFT